MENAIPQFKTALSKANVKTNRIGSSKCTKNEIFPLTILF